MRVSYDKSLQVLTYLVVFLALWGSPGGHWARAEDLPPAQELLERLQEVSRNVSYTGRRMFTLWLPKRTLSREERIIHQAGGEHRVQWMPGREMPAGVYVVRLLVEGR